MMVLLSLLAIGNVWGIHRMMRREKREVHFREERSRRLDDCTTISMKLRSPNFYIKEQLFHFDKQAKLPMAEIPPDLRSDLTYPPVTFFL